MAGEVLGTSLAEIASESAQQPFDAVIVGGGSAGLTAAMTLGEGGLRVAVLEAGRAPFLTHISNVELRFSRDATRAARGAVAYRPADLAGGGSFRDSFSCLGGRGLFWNGSAPRFQPHDFDGWPIGLGDLEEHYVWAERAYRVTEDAGRTDLADRLASKLRSAGFQAQPGPFAVDMGAIGDGHLSAGIASVLAPFLRSARDRLLSPALRLGLGCQATGVLFGTGRNARGVRADQDGSSHEVLASNVLLAAGGIESIRLASLSEVPDPYGRIGVGLQDHIFYRCYFEGPHIYSPERRETAVLHVPSASQETEQWELQAPGRLLWTMDDEFEWQPAPGPEYEVMVRAFAATEKRDANRVEVHSGGLGSATVHFEYSAADDRMRERVQSEALKFGGAMGMTLSDERLTGPGNSYHDAGGLDMGSDVDSSVTDPIGRFHHAANLWCVDSAAFPRIGATNPHLTIVAESRRKSLALLQSR